MLMRAGLRNFIVTFSRVNILLKIMLIAAAVTLALAAMYTFGTFVQFQPYRIIGYTVVPTSACPLEYVNVQINRDATRPTFGRITYTSGISYWYNPSTDKIVGAEPIIRTPFNGVYGEMSRTSPIQRTAPSEPGQYHLVTVLDVEGVVLNKAREVEGVSHQDPNVFTVLPCEAD